MGSIDFFTMGILIICLSFANLLAFFTLLFNAVPKIRWLFWTAFYLSMAGLSYFLLIIFFPEIFILKDPFSSLNVCAWLALLFIAVSAYFNGVWLSGKTYKKVGKVMVIFSSICLFFITVESVNIRFKQSDVKEIIIEEPCKIDSIQ